MPVDILHKSSFTFYIFDTSLCGTNDFAKSLFAERLQFIFLFHTHTVHAVGCDLI